MLWSTWSRASETAKININLICENIILRYFEPSEKSNFKFVKFECQLAHKLIQIIPQKTWYWKVSSPEIKTTTDEQAYRLLENTFFRVYSTTS